MSDYENLITEQIGVYKTCRENASTERNERIKTIVIYFSSLSLWIKIFFPASQRLDCA